MAEKGRCAGEERRRSQLKTDGNGGGDVGIGRTKAKGNNSRTVKRRSSVDDEVIINSPPRLAHRDGRDASATKKASKGPAAATRRNTADAMAASLFSSVDFCPRLSGVGRGGECGCNASEGTKNRKKAVSTTAFPGDDAGVISDRRRSSDAISSSSSNEGVNVGENVDIAAAANSTCPDVGLRLTEKNFFSSTSPLSSSSSSLSSSSSKSKRSLLASLFSLPTTEAALPSCLSSSWENSSSRASSSPLRGLLRRIGDWAELEGKGETGGGASSSTRSSSGSSSSQRRGVGGEVFYMGRDSGAIDFQASLELETTFAAMLLQNAFMQRRAHCKSCSDLGNLSRNGSICKSGNIGTWSSTCKSKSSNSSSGSSSSSSGSGSSSSGSSSSSSGSGSSSSSRSNSSNNSRNATTTTTERSSSKNQKRDNEGAGLGEGEERRRCLGCYGGAESQIRCGACGCSGNNGRSSNCCRSNKKGDGSSCDGYEDDAQGYDTRDDDDDGDGIGGGGGEGVDWSLLSIDEALFLRFLQQATGGGWDEGDASSGEGGEDDCFRGSGSCDGGRSSGGGGGDYDGVAWKGGSRRARQRNNSTSGGKRKGAAAAVDLSSFLGGGERQGGGV